MPTSKFIQSFLNPLKFIPYSATNTPKYLSKHMDDFFYYETIRPWQQRRQYYQPWMNTDRISLQFQSNLDPVKVSLIDVDERVYNSTTFSQLLYSFDDPTMFLYEGGIDLNPYGAGLYFVKVECGVIDSDGNFPLTLISEPIEIASVHKDSLLLEYSHYEFYNDIVFETGFAPEIRIRATLRLKSLSSKDTFFEDQPLNMTMLQSRPYRIFQLLIGGAKGIPDYLADMLNRIFGCSNLLIDGKPFTKSDGAKMEDNSQDNYPMRGWAIDLREAENITANIYQDGFLIREEGSYILREDGGRFIL
jgi:hypothetical protein